VRNEATGCTGAALTKAMDLCVKEFGKPFYDDCVADVCQTGDASWADQDAEAEVDNAAQKNEQAEEVMMLLEQERIELIALHGGRNAESITFDK
jgi:hypothetical protein